MRTSLEWNKQVSNLKQTTLFLILVSMHTWYHLLTASLWCRELTLRGCAISVDIIENNTNKRQTRIKTRMRSKLFPSFNDNEKKTVVCVEFDHVLINCYRQLIFRRKKGRRDGGQIRIRPCFVFQKFICKIKYFDESKIFLFYHFFKDFIEL